MALGSEGYRVVGLVVLVMQDDRDVAVRALNL